MAGAHTLSGLDKEVKGVKGSLWDISSRLSLLENFMKEQFGDAFWTFCERSCNSPTDEDQQYYGFYPVSSLQTEVCNSPVTVTSTSLLKRNSTSKASSGPLHSKGNKGGNVGVTFGSSAAKNASINGQQANVRSGAITSSTGSNRVSIPPSITITAVSEDVKPPLPPLVAVPIRAAVVNTKASKTGSGLLNSSLTIKAERPALQKIVQLQSQTTKNSNSNSAYGDAVKNESGNGIIVKPAVERRAPNLRFLSKGRTTFGSSVPHPPKRPSMDMDESKESVTAKPYSIEVTVDPSTLEFDDDSDLEEYMEQDIDDVDEDNYGYEVDSSHSSSPTFHLDPNTLLAFQMNNSRSSTSSIRTKEGMRPTPCHPNCQNKCSEWDEEDRKCVYNQYNSLSSYQDKEAFIVANVEKTEIAKKKTLYSNFRTCTFKYYLPHPRIGLRQVCKAFFCATLGEPRNIIEKTAQTLKNPGPIPSGPIPFARRLPAFRRKRLGVDSEGNSASLSSHIDVGM